MPKSQYTIKKIVNNGCEKYNKSINRELISTNYTDSFLYNRNIYIELYEKDYKNNCNYQLKIKKLDYEIVKPKEEKEES